MKERLIIDYINFNKEMMRLTEFHEYGGKTVIYFDIRHLLESSNLKDRPYSVDIHNHDDFKLICYKAEELIEWRHDWTLIYFSIDEETTTLCVKLECVGASLPCGCDENYTCPKHEKV